MADAQRKSHARISYESAKEPCPIPSPDLIDRDEWIEQVYNGFVSPSKANKEYYKVILQTLWPKGHGIPGPIVEPQKIRDAINEYRGSYYQDAFRRMRELQGEEGLLGIIKVGNSYQLIDITIYDKRIPRTHLSDNKWQEVLGIYGYVCAACGRTQEEIGFQQDHKVPRLRGGSDDLSNWQPLCDECNNFKSTACRDCKLDCTKCCWAFPEKYKPLSIPGDIVQALREYAKDHDQDPNQIVTDLIIEKICK